MNKDDFLQQIKQTATHYKCSGFHCSETVIRTMNDCFEMHMQEETIKAACGFRGGGGGTRHRCGILESGMMVISLLYGRNTPEEEAWPYSYLIRLLHQRFQEHFGTIDCLDIYTKQKALNVPNTCLEPIIDGCILIAELLLEAPTLLKNAPEEEHH